jgi:hypothetical protein
VPRDELLREAFRAAYKTLLADEGSGPAKEEQAWARFRQSPQADRAAAQLAQGAPAARGELAAWLRPVFDLAWEWATRELADEVLFEPGNALHCRYEPRANGTPARFFLPAGAPPPGNLTGRPQEN